MSLKAQAQHLAGATGASPDDIAYMRTNDALMKCLELSNIDADLVEDVAEACELGEVDALTLAADILPLDKVADVSFLTESEAQALIWNCTTYAHQSGVTFGKPLPAPLHTPIAFSPASLNGQRPLSARVSATGSASSSTKPCIPLLTTSRNGSLRGNVVDSTLTATPPQSHRSITGSVTSSTPSRPQSTNGSILPTRYTPAVPVGMAVGMAFNKHGMKDAQVEAQKDSYYISEPNPRNIAAVMAPDVTHMMRSSDSPSVDTIDSAQSDSSQQRVPSTDQAYADRIQPEPRSFIFSTPHSTQTPSAYQAATSLSTLDSMSPQSATSPFQSPVPSPPRPAARAPHTSCYTTITKHPASAPVNIPKSPTRLYTPRFSPRPQSVDSPGHLDTMDSGVFLKYPGHLPSFMRPTTAHEMRTRRDPTPNPPSPTRPRALPVISPRSNLTRSTASFAAKVLSERRAKDSRSQDNQRGRSLTARGSIASHVTVLQPFHLSSPPKRTSASPRMSTEERRLHEAKQRRLEENLKWDSQIKRASMPTTCHSARGPTQFKLFNLSSTARHEHVRHDLQLRVRQAEEAADQARVFKAQPFNLQSKAMSRKTPPRKVSPMKTTIPKGPSFATDNVPYRAQVAESHYRNTHHAHAAALESARKEKLDKLSQEADSIRKAHTFKAKPLPDFSQPFTPDPSKVAAPTVSRLPKLATTIRLGSTHYTPPLLLTPSKPCVQKMGSSPHGHSTEFAMSLRSKSVPRQMD